MYISNSSVYNARLGDSFQALVGAAGAMGNAFGRIFWGSVSDSVGFKRTFTLLTLSQAALHLAYPFASAGKPYFILAHALSHMCLGGNFALMPIETVRLFGSKNGMLLYGFLFSAFGVASIAGLYVSKVCRNT